MAISSSTNQKYRRWYRRKFTGLAQKMAAIENGFADATQRRVRERQRELHPRKRKNFPLLSAAEARELMQDLRVRTLAELMPIASTRTRALKMRSDNLFRWAPDVEIIPEEYLYLSQVSSTSTYNYQPAANFYARHELTPFERQLQKRGCKTHVRYVQYHPTHKSWGTASNPGGRSSGVFELWVNIPDWMADSVCRTITIDDALEALPPTCNAKVLYPDLSDALFAKHMTGGYRKKA